MAKFSLRRYDTQARVGLIIAIVAAGVMLVQACAVLQNMNWGELVIEYRSGTLRRPAVLGLTAMTVLLALFGFGLGLNSVGQKRNDKQGWSWLAFFISAGVICLAIVVFALFHFRGSPMG